MKSAVKATNTFPVAFEFGETLEAMPHASSHSPQLKAPTIMIDLLPQTLFILNSPTCTPTKPIQVIMMVYSKALVMPARLRKYVW
jgi:hypothetical protein